jgi:hypothetical protein
VTGQERDHTKSCLFKFVFGNAGRQPDLSDRNIYFCSQNMGGKSIAKGSNFFKGSNAPKFSGADKLQHTDFGQFWP